MSDPDVRRGTYNRPFWLASFVFPIEVPEELNPLSFHNLYVDMHVYKTKFEGNSSLGCYHMTCIEKKNIEAKEVYYNMQRC